MSAVDYILEGLAAELELERELGVRTLEVDRTLLAATPPPKAPSSPAVNSPAPARPAPEKETKIAVSTKKSTEFLGPVPTGTFDFIFLHDRPLSPGGREMMAKITAALDRTDESAPVIVDAPIPKTAICVVLGGRAMHKFFPGMKGEPGRWMRDDAGRDVLITYSPEYILRFGTVTPAVKKMKWDMWQALKGVVQRVAQATR